MSYDHDLDQVNTERKKKGLPPLSKVHVDAAKSSYSSSDNSFMDFLIGYTTGVPMGSASGVVGAMLHSEAEALHSPQPDHYDPPAPAPDSCAPSSNDSSSSSYDSSSSCDSGSYSSDSGGGSF